MSIGSKAGAWFVREPDPNDRRAKIVMLTEPGQRLSRRFGRSRASSIAEVTAPLGRDGERLRKMLVGLRGALQERRDG